MTDSAETSIRFDLEESESWKRIAHVVVEQSYMEEMRDAAAKRMSKKIKLDGFRPGKVPVHKVRQMAAAAVEQEALERLIPDVYQKVLDNHEGLHPVSDPRVENLEVPEGEPIRFDLVLEVRPDLDITGLDRVEATRYLPPMTDDRVEEAIENMRQRQAHWHEREEGAVEEGDAVLMDTMPIDTDGMAIEGEEAETDQAVLVGGEGMLPEFSAALVGMNNGEETDIEVNYPVDYPNEELRGSTRRLRIAVKEIRVKHLPELDDEFAKAHSGKENLAEMREMVREQLTEGTKRESDRQLREQLVDKLLELNEIPVLPSLEERYVQAMVEDFARKQGIEEATDEQREQLTEAWRPMAQRAVKRMLLMDNLRRSHDIKVDEDEFNTRLAEMAEKQGTEPDRFRLLMERAGNLDRFRGEIEEDKVFDLIEESAKITVAEETADVETSETKA
jgi:trigger factor